MIVPDAADAAESMVLPDVDPATARPFLTLNSFAISFHFPRNEDCYQSSPHIKTTLNNQQSALDINSC